MISPGFEHTPRPLRPGGGAAAPPERAVREGVAFRIAYIVLGVSPIIGGSLESVIPYTPAFPIVVLAASAVCLGAALRADWYRRLLPEPRQSVGGLLYTAFIGSVVDLLYSGLSTIKGALHVSGGAASGGSLNVLLALSWPAVVISALAIALAIRVTRRIRGRVSGPHRHAALALVFRLAGRRPQAAGPGRAVPPCAIAKQGYNFTKDAAG